MRQFPLIHFLCVACGFFVVKCDASISEVYALNSFKEAIYEDPTLALSNWNALEEDPCDWFGISCSPTRDRVLKLNVSRSSLKGFLAPELGLLVFLEELILHGNNLISSIPNEIGMLKYLTVLDLGMNQLSGPIPPEIGGLTSLIKVNLESNGLAGHLPPELGNLENLEELRIDRNKLQGTFPASNSSDLSPNNPGMLSFQGNCLNGQDLKQRHAAQCPGTPLDRSNSESGPNHMPIADQNKHVATPKSTSGSKSRWLLPLEIVTGTVAGFVFLIGLFSAFRRLQTKPSISIPWKKSGSIKEQMAIPLECPRKNPLTSPR